MLDEVGDRPRSTTRGPRRARRGARRDRHRARRQGVRLPVLLPHRRRRAAGAGPGEPGDGAGRRGRLHPDDHAGAGPARRRWRAPASSAPTRPRSTGWRTTTSTWSAPPRCRSPATTSTRSWTCRPAAALRRLLAVLSARGRLLRQGHQGHHPGAPVRQGRDVPFCAPEDAEAEHQRLLGWEREFLDSSSCPTG